MWSRCFRSTESTFVSDVWRARDCTGSQPMHMTLAALNLQSPPPVPFDAHGIVVTGGGRGIGLYISEGYVRSGATVYISSRRAQSCEDGTQRAGVRR